MSVIRPRCSRCSVSASRCGRSIPCSSPITPATSEWQGEVFHAELISEAGRRHRAARRARRMRRRAVGLYGQRRIGAAILDAVRGASSANPSAHYCCDPVIGDVGRGIFVAQGIPEFIKSKAVPAADIVTPNQFELDYLAGRESKTLATGARGGEGGARSRAARDPGHVAALPRRRRRTRSICWPPTASVASVCARRGCS